MGDEAEELARRLGALEALLVLALVEMLEGRGEERLGDEGVLAGVGVGAGKVLEGLDGQAGVLFEDAAEAAEEAEAQDEGGSEKPRSAACG